MARGRGRGAEAAATVFAAFSAVAGKEIQWERGTVARWLEEDSSQQLPATSFAVMSTDNRFHFYFIIVNTPIWIPRKLLAMSHHFRVFLKFTLYIIIWRAIYIKNIFYSLPFLIVFLYVAFTLESIFFLNLVSKKCRIEDDYI